MDLGRCLFDFSRGLDMLTSISAPARQVLRFCQPAQRMWNAGPALWLLSLLDIVD